MRWLQQLEHLAHVVRDKDTIDYDDPAPIYRYLDMIGLPWRAPYEELVRRYGVSAHPAYEWDVIPMQTAKPFSKGLLFPLHVNAGDYFPAAAPAIDFHGSIHYGRSARSNMRLAVRELSRHFGAGFAYGDCTHHAWHLGAASVQLWVWPEWDAWRPRNDAHERDPRLVQACALQISTAYRRALSERDHELLFSFVPIARMPWIGADEPRLDLAPSVITWTYIREPEPRYAWLYRWLGRSGDRSTLIVLTDQLYLVPVADIVRVDVLRERAGKGGSSSAIILVCRNGCQDGSESGVMVATDFDEDALSEPGAHLAQTLGIPLVLKEYTYNA